VRETHHWWQYEDQGRIALESLWPVDRDTSSREDSPLNTGRNHPTILPASRSDPGLQDPFTRPENEHLFDLNLASAIPSNKQQSRGPLPADFVRSFCLDNSFKENYLEINFGLALAALDYLSRLERTRRESLSLAAHSLKISLDNWVEVLSADPPVRLWVHDVQQYELLIERYYADMYLDLRIWVCYGQLFTVSRVC
jgi:hypothetical protein